MSYTNLTKLAHQVKHAYYISPKEYDVGRAMALEELDKREKKLLRLREEGERLDKILEKMQKRKKERLAATDRVIRDTLLGGSLGAGVGILTKQPKLRSIGIGASLGGGLRLLREKDLVFRKDRPKDSVTNL